MKVLLFGGTGTAGNATLKALLDLGHDVTCAVRTLHKNDFPTKAKQVVADVTRPAQDLLRAFEGAHFDVVISCLASRTGSKKDAWTIDHLVHLNILALAEHSGVSHFILLSAICVQKPELSFQHAKLEFENALIGSDLNYTIVRPTAFFKSLSGQIERLRAGKPFLVFGDGALTSCKPISDDDLGQFIANCIENSVCINKILPIGGPGDAITPLDQGKELFRLMGQKPKFKHVPIAMMSAIYQTLKFAGMFNAKAAEKAELARIGRYYARESMLLMDPETGLYDADLTPSTGTETLFDFYASVIAGDATVERGDHSVF
ncbi:NAD(P)H-binding protein [Planktotalea sp.]|uniref:NAD(P)H-binding protein n=1 Tax=Planktotalea sp. TaxID=2029877 RepID=UPI0025F80A8E|nr:NAD(P)H-binding protein [Planktotalea sp.]